MKKNDPERASERFRAKFSSTGSEVRQIGLAFAIPGMLLAGPLVGYGLGWCIDMYLGAPEWVRPIGLVLGFIAGIRETVIALKKLTAEQNKKSDE